MLIVITEFVYQPLDKIGKAWTVALDISKWFDKVWPTPQAQVSQDEYLT